MAERVNAGSGLTPPDSCHRCTQINTDGREEMKIDYEKYE
jgi:hypothetical protein